MNSKSRMHGQRLGNTEFPHWYEHELTLKYSMHHNSPSLFHQISRRNRNMFQTDQLTNSTDGTDFWRQYGKCDCKDESMKKEPFLMQSMKGEEDRCSLRARKRVPFAPCELRRRQETLSCTLLCPNFCFPLLDHIYGPERGPLDSTYRMIFLFHFCWLMDVNRKVGSRGRNTRESINRNSWPK